MLRIGLFKLHGRQPPGLKARLLVGEAGTAMGVGFEELKRFPASFDELLDELSTPAVRERGGPVGKYGSRFYSFMQRDGDGHLEPFRTRFEHHAGLAAKAADSSSRSQSTRKLWETALTGSETKRLRRLLDLPGGPPLTRREALKRCHAADAVISIGHASVELRIGQDTAKELARRRVFGPTWSNHGLLHDWYYRQDIADFKERVMALARPVNDEPEDTLRLADFKHFALKVSGVLAATVDGVVKPLRIADEEDFDALIFSRSDVATIWNFSTGEERMEVANFRRAALLSTDLFSVALDRKLITVKTVLARRSIALKDVERFRRRYASARDLATAAGVPTGTLIRELDELGCEPLIKVRGGRLYKRASAERPRERLPGREVD